MCVVCERIRTVLVTREEQLQREQLPRMLRKLRINLDFRSYENIGTDSTAASSA